MKTQDSSWYAVQTVNDCKVPGDAQKGCWSKAIGIYQSMQKRKLHRVNLNCVSVKTMLNKNLALQV